MLSNFTQTKETELKKNRNIDGLCNTHTLSTLETAQLQMEHLYAQSD